jgi:hypothetical protein
MASSEQFTFSVSLGQGNVDIDTPIAFVGGLAPNAAVYGDLRDDLADFWNGAAIAGSSVLRSVKFASIKPDGHYAAAPVELTCGGSSGLPGASGGAVVPNQIALAVTLHTDADLGRVKGRFYLPTPALGLGTDARLSEANQTFFRNLSQTFLNAVNNQPGLDALDLRVVVASSGRKNDDGSVRLPPANHLVTGVTVGRVYDTIRRRRNKIPESRGVPAQVG